MWNLETIAMLLLPTLLNLETVEIGKLLDKQHENNPAVYKGIVLTIAAWEDAIETLVDKSATKIDDQILAANISAIKAHAEKNGLTWPNS